MRINRYNPNLPPPSDATQPEGTSLRLVQHGPGTGLAPKPRTAAAKNVATEGILPKRPRPKNIQTTWKPQPDSLLLGTIPEIRNQILAKVVRDDKDALNVTLTCRQLFHEGFVDRDDAVERERVRNVTVNYIAEHRARNQLAADLEAAAARGPA